MAENPIVASKENNVLTIKLNRVNKRNAISLDMVFALEAEIEKAADAKDVRVVVIRGEGPCFSSGIDFNVLAELASRFPSPASFRYFLPKLQEVFNKIETLEKPVIAVLHGYCWGMGLELALAADFRIAAEDCTIALQETELGMIPDVGGTTRLVRTVGIPLAKEIIMTARKLDAREALSIHLVNEVVPQEELDSALSRWIERIMNCAPLAVGIAKKIIDRGAHLDKYTMMALEGMAQTTLLNSDDVKEGVMARIQKRKPEFKGK